jgi:hypothetical protein
MRTSQFRSQKEGGLTTARVGRNHGRKPQRVALLLPFDTQGMPRIDSSHLDASQKRARICKKYQALEIFPASPLPSRAGQLS